MLKENMDAMNKMSDIKDSLFYRELNAKLIRENRELKADAKHDADVCYDLDDKHVKIITSLKADVESLEAQLNNAVDDYEELLERCS